MPAFRRFLVGACVASQLAAAPLVTPEFTATGELWQNTRGGARTGGWWNTLVDLGLTCDTAALGGPANSSVYVQAQWVQNRSASECFAGTTGAFNPVSGLMAGNHVRVFNLYYRQSWRAGAVTLKLGQLALDDDFMTSDSAALFANAAFGALPSQVSTSLSARCGHTAAFPLYAVASPGLHFQLAPPGRWSWQLAIYDGGPGADTPANHGFSWNAAAHSGVLVFTEAGHDYAVASHTASVHLGVSYHSGQFDDLTARACPRSEPSVRGLYGVYVVNEMVIVAGQDAPRLTAFVRAGLSPQQDRTVVTTSFDAGLDWHGPFARRLADVAGVAVSVSEFGRDYRRTAGSDRTETTVEFTYKAQLTAHWTLQPDAQFLVSASRPTAIVAGLRAAFSL